MGDRTKVLSVVSSADRRGAEVFATSLAAHAGDHEADIDVVALSPASTADPLPIDVLGSGRSDPRALRALWERTREVDVLVSNGGTTLLPVAGAAFAARRPFVYRNIGDPAAWGDVALASVRLGLPLRRAAAVVALTQSTADELRHRYRLATGRTTVVPNAVDATGLTPATDAERAAAREAVELDPSAAWIAWIGAFSEEKRPELAIDAMAELPGHVLLMAGGGPLLEACRARAASVAPGRVAFLGIVPSPVTVLHACDVLVLSSRTEGIPAVVIEAALCGLPVAATDVGGVSTTVIDGVTGVLSPSGDAAALARAVGTVTADPSMGNRGRAHCLEHHTIEGVAPRWAEVLRAARRT